jgi:DNA-binding CsgD family transcriptional regulator
MDVSAARVLDVVEAAYQLEVADDHWLRGVAAGFEAALGDGSGTIAMIPRATDVPSRFEHAVGVEIGDWWREQLVTFEQIPRPIYDAFSRAGPLLYWSQIYGRVAQDQATTEFFEQRAHALHGKSDEQVIAEAREGKAVPGAPPPERLALACYDATGQGVGIVVAHKTLADRPASEHAKTIWGRVAAHVCAGRRLRQRAVPTLDGAEAVLDGGGRLHHASGGAVEAAARDALREAAVARDRARTRRRGDKSADIVTAQWKALVSGRWSLVDSFDTDGRRYVIAEANSPMVEATANLSIREAQVLACARLGHANKAIAYELGIAESTVAGHLARAARKLGARSRAELIQSGLKSGT